MTVLADTPIVISTEAKRSGEISPSDSTGDITVEDLSTQSIMGAFPICPIPTRSPARDDERAVSPYRHVKKKRARLAPGLWPSGCSKKEAPHFEELLFHLRGD